MRYKSPMIFVALIMVLAISVAGCAGERPLESISESRFLLDTLCTITVYADNAKELISESFELIRRYEGLFSITIEGSDIWRINNAGGMPTAVSPETVELLMLGLEYGRLSDGLFDITVGRLSRLWGFGSAPVVPSRPDIARAMETVDFRQVLIDGNNVMLSNPEAWIDLGGIAKGFILDRLASFLIQRGATGAVIELGGDIAVLGERPGGGPWRIGIRQPFGAGAQLIGVIETTEAAVITSGTYERKFEEDGARYHHILDPTTGMPAISDVVSVTVVAESAAVGDALTSIIILLGSERAGALLSQVPGIVGAVLVLEGGEILKIGDISFSWGGDGPATPQ
ncbi:MAG: FAD:protein FMN transferase [Oscillospiraceae bacterium]|nr:FAD:protein FMN transferase [Oscillospiraceae bacterium]